MSVVLGEVHGRLRLRPAGHDTGQDGDPLATPARHLGVIILDKVPPGVDVRVWVDRPTELNEASVAPLAQGYRFDRAPLPPQFSVGAGSPATFRTRARVLLVDPGTPGNFIATEREPAWAGFPVPQVNALVQKGKRLHTLPTRGQPGDTPGLAPSEADLIRMRWTGVAVAGATLIVVAGLTAASNDWTAAKHKRLAPGSIIVTLPTSLGILRDNGAGRLVGANGDGVVDYLTGQFKLKFNVAEAGAVLVDYEHSCQYAPLDAKFEWDVNMA